METSRTDNSATQEERLTRQQQKALHAWFGMVAEVLNEDGKTMAMVLNKFIVDAPATKNSIKELVWKPLQQGLYGKKSTTELLKREEIDKIYDTLNKFFAENLEVALPPFPSVENNIINQKEYV